MGAIKAVIILVIILTSLVVCQPSFANTDIDSYKTENIQFTTTYDESKPQIFELSNRNWGQCTNNTGKIIGVYISPPPFPDYEYHNVLMYLADGRTTQDGKDCDGFYVPNDRKVTALTPSGGSWQGPAAVKIQGGEGVAGTIIGADHVIVRGNPNPSFLEININPVAVWPAGQLPSNAKWFVPNVAQNVLDTRIPSAPTND